EIAHCRILSGTTSSTMRAMRIQKRSLPKLMVDSSPAQRLENTSRLTLKCVLMAVPKADAGFIPASTPTVSTKQLADRQKTTKHQSTRNGPGRGRRTVVFSTTVLPPIQKANPG